MSKGFDWKNQEDLITKIDNSEHTGWDPHGFHCFTEIGHIFNNKYIFNNQTHFSSLNLANTFLFE